MALAKSGKPFSERIKEWSDLSTNVEIAKPIPSDFDLGSVRWIDDDPLVNKLTQGKKKVANENPFGKGLVKKTAPKVDNPFGRGVAKPVAIEPVSPAAREPHEVTREERVMKEFNKAPMTAQAMQAADDMVRLFSTGATYNASDTFGSPESRFQTDDARARAGIPGMVSEVGGMIASPVTRAVGAGARALPGAGAVPRVAKAVGEGASLGGIGALLSDNPENLVQDMAMGGILPPALMAASKMVTLPAKYLSSILSGKPPEAYRKAFTAGREDGPVGKAFREGASQGVDAIMPPDLVDEFSSKKKDWLDTAEFAPIGNRLVEFISNKRTSSGVFDLTSKELKQLNDINNEVLKAGNRAPTIENLNALRTRLGAFNSTKKAKEGTIGRFATQLQSTIEEQITKQNKTYGKDLATYGRGKSAFEAGQKLSKTLPNASSIGNMALNVAGIAGAGIGGALFSPALFAAIPALAVAGSPKAAGKIAHTVGKTLGIGDLLSGGKSDAAAPMAIYNSLSEKEKKKLRKLIPGIQ